VVLQEVRYWFNNLDPKIQYNIGETVLYQKEADLNHILVREATITENLEGLGFAMSKLLSTYKSRMHQPA
jgi:hypothetical protein